MKLCGTCKESKSESDFHKKSGAKDGLQSSCKPCRIAVVKKWQQDNPERYAKIQAKHQKTPEGILKRRARIYGITIEELQGLHESADGRCAICKVIPAEGLSVDHCHESLVVRGLLCGKCNKALGLFADNIETLQSAIEYLGTYSAIGRANHS